MFHFLHQSHSIHGIGIFTYIYHKKTTIHVGKSTSPMDPMGMICVDLPPKNRFV